MDYDIDFDPRENCSHYEPQGDLCLSASPPCGCNEDMRSECAQEMAAEWHEAAMDAYD